MVDVVNLEDLHYIIDIREEEDLQMAVSPRSQPFFPPQHEPSLPGQSLFLDDLAASCLPPPLINFESYDEFESAVIMTQMALQASTEQALARVDPETLETAFAHVLIDAMFAHYPRRARVALLRLTKGHAGPWLDRLAAEITTAVRFLTRVYVHTIAGHPEATLEVNFVQLRAMIDAEVWEILTRSKPYGTVFMKYPMFRYEGAVGQLLAMNFFAVVKDGETVNHIPIPKWPEFCVAFCCGVHPRLGGIAAMHELNPDIMRLILSQIVLDCALLTAAA